MGVQLGDLVPKKAIGIEDLAGRKIAIDAYNALYQFLSIIRQPDGTPLQDSEGRVTSHLSGLFYRTTRLMEAGIQPCYVFDGKPPGLKRKTNEERKKIRAEAKKRWEDALVRGEIEEAKRHAQASSRLTGEMVEDAKALLDAVGIPWVQAPGEGEAQAAFMTNRGDVWAAASQDYDSLLFGAVRLVRSLTLAGRRKLPRKNVFVEVEPELIELENALKTLGVSREQLVDVGILCGTDYNKGVHGIGPKKALQAVRAGKSAEQVFVEAGAEPEVDVAVLRTLFLEPEVTQRYALEWGVPEKQRVVRLLVEEHDFSAERVEKAVADMLAAQAKRSQSKLESWY